MRQRTVAIAVVSVSLVVASAFAITSGLLSPIQPAGANPRTGVATAPLTVTCTKVVAITGTSNPYKYYGFAISGCTGSAAKTRIPHLVERQNDRRICHNEVTQRCQQQLSGESRVHEDRSARNNWFCCHLSHLDRGHDRGNDCGRSLLLRSDRQSTQHRGLE
jgi:hypothetical protein